MIPGNPWPLEPTQVAYAISCGYCAQLAGERCVTTTRRVRTYTHHERWRAANRDYRTREMWYVLRDDDPRFGLEAGDILRCIQYPYDAKVTVLFREWDGYNPECNQYLNAVAFLGFVPRDMEVRR